MKQWFITVVVLTCAACEGSRTRRHHLTHDTLLAAESLGPSTFRASLAERASAQALVNGWAQTGSCGDVRFRGECGVIAAVSPSVGADFVVVTAAAGGVSPSPTAVFTPSTLFEIASNTKVFTAIAFEWLVLEGTVGPNETLNDLLRNTSGIPLPPTPRWKDPAVGTITLRELSTHTSGLPRLPSNLHGTPQNVFTGYTDDDLFGFLGNLSALPTRGQFLYSNLAFGLLGRLLELKTGISYEALVRKILLNPLGMNDTKIALTPTEWQTDVAPGRNASGQFAERNTPYGVLKGQGAFHSSIRDMAKFVSASVAVAADNPVARNRLPPKLWSAMATCMTPTVPNDYPITLGRVGYAWEMYASGGPTHNVIWKSGSTDGYGSFMAINPSTGRSTVALGSCGCCGHHAVAQLTRQLVDAPPDSSHSDNNPVMESTFDSSAYTGCYELPRFVDRVGHQVRNATLVTVTSPSGTNLLVQIGARRVPTTLKFLNVSFPPSSELLPNGFSLVNDTFELFPGSSEPLVILDRQSHHRELYFMAPKSWHVRRAPSCVLHIDGWDMVAGRVPCPVKALSQY